MPLTGTAAARLYDDHVDAVHAMIARRVGKQLAPLVTAAAFEHALRTWDRFESDRGTERLFLLGAAAAALRSHASAEAAHLRSLRPQAGSMSLIADPLVAAPQIHEPGTVDMSSPVGEPVESPASPVIEALIALPPDDRDIVLLSLWESCPQAAVAEALELSISTVRSALGRIRRDLKAAATGATS